MVFIVSSIRGAVLALRKEEASLILVKKIRDRSVL